jgi:nicotinamide-nucleotide amidase
VTSPQRPDRSEAPDPAAARVLDLLAHRGETLATAESLTGGLIGELLTGVPGASRVYLGGVISYATRLKATLAGVPQATLDHWGPVAAPTAQQMAQGVADRCDAVWGLAVTGVAGPEPQDGHPVGQVFVGVAHPTTRFTTVAELSLAGSRDQIRWQTARRALELLVDVLGMNSEDRRVE